MTRVYAFDTHRYIHGRPGKTPEPYTFPKGEVRDVPEDVANIVCHAHPQKLRILGEHEAPPSEVETAEAALEGAGVTSVVVEEPPTDRMMRPTRRTRRRKTLRAS